MWLMMICLVVFAASGCLSLSGDDGDGFATGDSPPTDEQVDLVEEFLGASIPNSAVADQTRAELLRGIDDALYLRVSIDPGDVGSFLAEVGVDETLQPSLDGVVGGTDQEWFQTDGLAAIEGVSTIDPVSGRAVRATVDVADPATSVVYLNVFEV